MENIYRTKGGLVPTRFKPLIYRGALNLNRFRRNHQTSLNRWVKYRYTMNYLKPISVYKDYFSTNTGLATPLNQFLRTIYSDDYKGVVEGIRAEEDKKKRDALKATLPAATISGTFSERRKSGLIQHSGFICLDIDAKDNPDVRDWRQVRDEVSKIVNVHFAALSVSGQGLFLIIPVSNPEKHESHFDALRIDFQDLGYVIDKSCRDVSRLRGMSYDPDARINRAAIPYERTYQRLRASTHKRTNTAHLDQLLKKIIESGTDITSGYDPWFRIGRALVNEYGENGREHFHQLSRLNPNYSYDECDRQYDKCLNSPGTAGSGTLFHYASEYEIILKNC